MLCKLVEEANRKGYSGSELCQYVNKAGLRCHINSFRRAVRDDIARTEGQEAIYNLASSILADLPQKNPDDQFITFKAKMAEHTLKEVWQYYCATREKHYTYGAFITALHRQMTPFEVRVANEANKCLAEMLEQEG